MSGIGLPFLASAYPWALASGIGFGAAVSRATRRTARQKDPEKAATRKWVLVCFYLSASVLLALAGVFLPSSPAVMDIRLLWVFLASAVLSAASFRFRKTAGSLILLSLIVIVLSFALFLQSLRAFSGETEIAVVRVLSVDDSRMKLEVSPSDPSVAAPTVLDLEGRYFAPVVKVVIFDDLFVFLGVKTWYRFMGMTSFRVPADSKTTELKQGQGGWWIRRPADLAETMYAWFESNDGRIPGVKTVQIGMDLKKARERGSYSIRVQNDGGVEIVSLSD